MKKWAAGVMAALTLFLGMMGCGKTQPVPTVPEEKPLPGTLVGVNYATGGGMAYRTEFSIRLTKDEIEHTDFWPADFEKDEMEEKSHVPITEQQWKEVETLILELYVDRLLEEVKPTPESKRPSDFLDQFVLDGGDYTNLSLVWKTEEGIEEIGYCWPGDRRVITLVDLLQELAEPIGREIIWYESPRLDEIYFTRKHRVNNKRDFSFQLHYATYDEADPHWELIYYLGKHGAVDNGYIRLEQAHWDAFLALAGQLQLEYFPEATRSNDFFTCQLSYTDEKNKHIVLNDETEEQLKEFFMDLINQEK